MSNSEDQILRFRGYKKYQIYQCSKCDIWIKEIEKICPICGTDLVGAKLTEAELLQKRISSYFKYSYK